MTSPPAKHAARECEVNYSGDGSATVRVNARLDPATASELDQLVAQTGGTVTEILKTAIHRLYLERAAGKETVAEVFKDLIGCIDGPADLSTNKAYLSEYLDKKLGHR